MWKRKQAWWVRASVLGACLALASCGGRVAEEADAGAGGETPGDGGIPPVSGSPFVPGAGDLPHQADASLYVYGDPVPGSPTAAPSLLALNVLYQPTNAPKAPGPYQVDNRTCATLPAPPGSYPGGLVTLDTVNLDENGDDGCEPEIKVKLASNDGAIADAEAKMRVRGSSTRGSPLKSYRIKLDKAAKPWNGESTLQFNKHPWDLTRVRNKLAFDLMRLVPYHESLRTQFAQITYADGSGNAKDLGLFTHVEKMGDTYLARRGWVAGSNVYKAENFSFDSSQPNFGNLKAKLPTDQDVAEFEKVLSLESDSGDHHAIIDAVKALSDGNVAFSRTFDRYFNRNNYLAWLATAILLGNADTRTQNFGLYQPLGTEKFYFLPWDYDGALGAFEQPGMGYADTLIEVGVGNWWGVPLHRRFLSDRKNIADLKAAVMEIRGKYLTDANVKKLLDSYRPVVTPFIQRQPDNAYLAIDQQGAASPAQQWDTEFRRLETVIEKNYQSFLQSLERPMPFWVGLSDDQTGLSWDWPAPFHPQGRALAYTVQVASVAADAFGNSATVVKEVPGLTQTSLPLQTLASGVPAGNYLVRVKASDARGNWTYSFDSYALGEKTVFGAICLQLPSGRECEQ